MKKTGSLDQMALQIRKENMIGKKYTYFKDNSVYVVSNVVRDSKTGDFVVIYNPVDDTDLEWAKPLDKFLAKVNKDKYPWVKQERKFEIVK